MCQSYAFMFPWQHDTSSRASGLWKNDVFAGVGRDAQSGAQGQADEHLVVFIFASNFYTFELEK